MRTAMARSLAGWMLESLVYVLPAKLRTTQLNVLAMQLRIAFFTTLLPHIFANDGFIPMTADGTDERAFGPKLACPQTLFDGGDAVEDLAGHETFDDLDNLSRAVTRHRLHQKVDVIFVGAISKKTISYRWAMSKQMSLSTVSTAASKITRRYFAGRTIW